MNEERAWSDIARLGVLIIGSGAIAVALVVVFLYATLYVRTRRSEAADWKGLLPRHVTVIGVSYVGLIVSAMFELTSRLHHGWTWRTPVYGVLFTLGLMALWDVLGHSRHRLGNLNPPEPPETHPGMDAEDDPLGE